MTTNYRETSRRIADEMPEFKKGAALMEQRAVELEKEGLLPPSLSENPNKTPEDLISKVIQEYERGPLTQELVNKTWETLGDEWAKVVDRISHLHLKRTSKDLRA